MSAFFYNVCYNDFQLKQRGVFMAKIKLKTSLIVTGEKIDKIEYELEGIKVDNQIKFFEDKTSVILTILGDNLTLVRKTDEYTLEMRFDINEATYAVKGLGILNLNFTTKEINISDNEIKIVYDMNEIEYIYTVNIEVKK